MRDWPVLAAGPPVALGSPPRDMSLPGPGWLTSDVRIRGHAVAQQLHIPPAALHLVPGPAQRLPRWHVLGICRTQGLSKALLGAGASPGVPRPFLGPCLAVTVPQGLPAEPRPGQGLTPGLGCSIQDRAPQVPNWSRPAPTTPPSFRQDRDGYGSSRTLRQADLRHRARLSIPCPGRGHGTRGRAMGLSSVLSGAGVPAHPCKAARAGRAMGHTGAGAAGARACTHVCSPLRVAPSPAPASAGGHGAPWHRDKDRAMVQRPPGWQAAGNTAEPGLTLRSRRGPRSRMSEGQALVLLQEEKPLVPPHLGRPQLPREPALGSWEGMWAPCAVSLRDTPWGQGARAPDGVQGVSTYLLPPRDLPGPKKLSTSLGTPSLPQRCWCGAGSLSAVGCRGPPRRGAGQRAGREAGREAMQCLALAGDELISQKTAPGREE